jgi:hypothetical protein
MRYTRAQADRLSGTLPDLPAAEPGRLFNKLQLVTYLAPQVIDLQERGSSLAAIAAHLTPGGFQIGGTTPRTYLARAKSTARRGGRGHSRARATTRAGKRHGAGVLN